MNLESLISQIQLLDGTFKNEANKAVNSLLTIRNWLIGFYIVEYEQKGEDRAKYGENLLVSISDNISREGFSRRNLNLFRQFFLTYPQIQAFIPEYLTGQLASIRQTVSAESTSIMQTLSAQLQINENQSTSIMQTVSAQLQTNENQSITIRQTASAKLKTQFLNLI